MKDFIQEFKLEITIWVVAIITLLFFICILKVRNNCLEYKIEKYYDTTYTAVAVSTKNYGFLALNGWKTRKVCIKYK